MQLIIDSTPYLIKGLRLTIFITVVSLFVGFFVGLILAFFRLSKIKLLEWLAIVFINAVRGTPLIVQLFFIYLGLNSLPGISLDPVPAGIIAITINASAYIAEIIRAGIESIDKGQVEAARSSGLNNAQTMIHIVLPQSLRRMLPTFVNQSIITLKDTSLCSVIGIAELTQQGEIIIARTFESFKIWPVIGLLYFILVYILTQLANYIERRYEVY